MSNWFSRVPRPFNGGKREIFQQTVLGQFNIYIKINDFGPLSHTAYEN